MLIEDTVRRYTFQARRQEIGEVWQAGYFNDRERDFHHTFDHHIDELLHRFTGGEPPPIHARTGQRALALAYAAIQSFETGRRVSLG